MADVSVISKVLVHLSLIRWSCIILAPIFLQACSTDLFDDELHTTPEAKYVLPYHVGKTYSCTQGFNSNPSHFGSFSYSVDFGMSIGTIITAARNGRVVYVVESNSDSDRTAVF
ncbi:MAG: hypothetical protein A2X22_13165 [Bacteroidetes bacterium GWF2_49_14]|nr:MAG: hypothetical protein A2X22_13165 [Bacteroidetes bacterium GWF2_49_14]